MTRKTPPGWRPRDNRPPFGSGARQEWGDDTLHRFYCDHWRQPVTIEDDIVVYASAYCDRRGNAPWRPLDVGIYLSPCWAHEFTLASRRWAGPAVGVRAELALLTWPDGGPPGALDDSARVLAYGIAAARAGRSVEIGCHGGHGRTGTALAAMLVLEGLHPREAAVRVWDRYCDLAIETPGQLRFLFQLAGVLHRRGKEGFQTM